MSAGGFAERGLVHLNGGSRWQRMRKSIPSLDSLVIRLLLVALAFAGAVTVLLSLRLADPSTVMGRWEVGLAIAELVDSGPLYQRFVVALVAAAVGSFALAMAFRRAPGWRAPARSVLVDADERGLVLLDAAGVESIAAHAARRAPGVLDVEVRSVGEGATSVRVEADVAVHARGLPQDTGRKVRDAIVQAVERGAGVAVDDVEVRLTVVGPQRLAALVR